MSNSRLVLGLAVGLALVVIIVLSGAVVLPASMASDTAQVLDPTETIGRDLGTQGTAIAAPALVGDPIPITLLNIDYAADYTSDATKDRQLMVLRLRAEDDPICKELSLTGNCFTSRRSDLPSYPWSRGPAVMQNGNLLIEVQDSPMERSVQGKIISFDVTDGGTILVATECLTLTSNCVEQDSLWRAQPPPTALPGESLVTSMAKVEGVWQIGNSDLYVQINPDGTVLVDSTISQTNRGVHVEKESGRDDYLLTATISLEDSRMRWAETGGTMYADKKRYEAYRGLIGVYDLRLASNRSETELHLAVVIDRTVIGRSEILDSGPWIYVGPITR